MDPYDRCLRRIEGQTREYTSVKYKTLEIDINIKTLSYGYVWVTTTTYAFTTSYRIYSDRYIQSLDYS